MADRLSPLDATFLELEQADESAHMHIGALLVFDPGTRRPPSVKRLREQLVERLDVLPRFRRRLSRPHTGGLDWPTWQLDEGFRIEDHVRRAALPAPGGRRELLRWAGEYWSHRLDRDRPLWDVMLLEGLEGGRWGLATKTHHCLVDGVGSVDVGYLVLDASARAHRRTLPVPDELARADGSPRLARRLPAVLIGGARAGIEAVLHPGVLREAAEQSRALLELIVKEELMAAPRTSLNEPIGPRRLFEVVDAELADLKAVTDALGGTVNDVVLAATAGGLRRLLLERGEEPPDHGLRAMVPVSVRTAGERELGNRITSLFIQVPVAEPDPLHRYLLTMGEAEALKSGDQALGASTLIGLTGLAPPALHSFIARALYASRLFNVTITNVPGPPATLYAFGSRLEQILPLVPLAADHAVGIAALSYAGAVRFGLNGDDRAASDLAVLRDGIASSLGELLQLAGVRAAGRYARQD